MFKKTYKNEQRGIFTKNYISFNGILINRCNVYKKGNKMILKVTKYLNEYLFSVIK